MSRKKRSASPFELMDDDFDEDASSQSSRNDNPPIQRNAANARERARMRVLSSAFGRLKTKLPNIPSDTKLSKLDTLRLATMYIKQLKAVVEGNAPLGTNGGLGGVDDIDGSSLNDAPSCYLQLHSGAQSMNWPFGLHHQVNNHHHSSTRSHAPNSTSVTNGTTFSWSQTEGKRARYEPEDYQRQHESSDMAVHHEDNNNNNNNNTAYLLTLSSPPSSTAMLTTTRTPPNSQHHQEVIWYSETPSPDLSTSTSSSMGIRGYEDPPYHHNQRHNHSNLMEHLAHIQLTPPPQPLPHSSGSRSCYNHHNQQPIPHHHHHQHSSTQYHYPQDHQQNPATSTLLSNFSNSNHLAAASIR
ncbi:basic helix-loop-helix domain-containing transcription factor HLH54F [Haematobia irritans]|uniref:basic helix-loop-helix domain-containing transcription factor HLH54F n=1 Tax=Haematobia irritans TaxID=7368 RepID=UPI003F4F8C1B